MASSSEVLPWSTWPMIVTTGARGSRSAASSSKTSAASTSSAACVMVISRSTSVPISSTASSVSDCVMPTSSPRPIIVFWMTAVETLSAMARSLTVTPDGHRDGTRRSDRLLALVGRVAPASTAAALVAGVAGRTRGAGVDHDTATAACGRACACALGAREARRERSGSARAGTRPGAAALADTGAVDAAARTRALAGRAGGACGSGARGPGGCGTGRCRGGGARRADGCRRHGDARRRRRDGGDLAACGAAAAERTRCRGLVDGVTGQLDAGLGQAPRNLGGLQPALAGDICYALLGHRTSDSTIGVSAARRPRTWLHRSSGTVTWRRSVRVRERPVRARTTQLSSRWIHAPRPSPRPTRRLPSAAR